MHDFNVTAESRGLRGDDPVLENDAPPLDPTRRIKEAMRAALEACPRKRARVVTTMNELARREGIATNGRAGRVSEALLDQWVAQGSTGHLIPLRYLAIFCHAVGSRQPMAALVGLVGCDLAGEEELKLLAWARVEIQRRKVEKEARRLAEEVGA